MRLVFLLLVLVSLTLGQQAFGVTYAQHCKIHFEQIANEGDEYVDCFVNSESKETDIHVSEGFGLMYKHCLKDMTMQYLGEAVTITADFSEFLDSNGAVTSTPYHFCPLCWRYLMCGVASTVEVGTTGKTQGDYLLENGNHALLQAGQFVPLADTLCTYDPNEGLNNPLTLDTPLLSQSGSAEAFWDYFDRQTSDCPQPGPDANVICDGFNIVLPAPGCTRSGGLAFAQQLFHYGTSTLQEYQEGHYPDALNDPASVTCFPDVETEEGCFTTHAYAAVHATCAETELFQEHSLNYRRSAAKARSAFTTRESGKGFTYTPSKKNKAAMFDKFDDAVGRHLLSEDNPRDLSFEAVNTSLFDRTFLSKWSLVKYDASAKFGACHSGSEPVFCKFAIASDDTYTVRNVQALQILECSNPDVHDVEISQKNLRFSNKIRGWEYGEQIAHKTTLIAMCSGPIELKDLSGEVSPTMNIENIKCIDSRKKYPGCI